MFHWVRNKISDASGSTEAKRGFRPTKIQIILAILIVLAIFELILVRVSVNNYGGYDLVNSDRYVSFEMPEADTVTSKQWKTLVANAEMDSYPNAQLQTEMNHIRSQYDKRIKEYDMTVEEYLGESNLTAEEFEAKIENLAKQNVKEKLILRAICKEKDITVTKEELENEKQKIISERGATDEADYERLTGETIEDHAQEIDLKSQLLYHKLVVD